MSEPSRLPRYGMRVPAPWATCALLLAIPLVMIFVKTFENGISEPLDSITSPEGLHAFWLTILCVAIAVPLNTVFGVLCALMLVRQNFRGKAIINSLIDLPFAVSPVVIGLALFLVYGVGRLHRRAAERRRHPDHLLRPRAWSWRRSSSRCRSWCAR